MSQNSDSQSESKSTRLAADKDSTLHPVGIGVGAAGGGLAGAALGSLVGPVGTLVGGAIGVATGAMAGQSVVEAIDPAVEDAYWRENYGTRDYVIRNIPYDDYQSAYQYGWESRARFGDRPFHEIELDLERGWELAKKDSKLAWVQAKHATRDAWHRITTSKQADDSCCSK